MPIGDLLASINGEEPSPTSTVFPTKRKADEDLRKPVQKSQRMETQPANSSRPTSQSSKPSNLGSLTSKSAPAQNGRPPFIQNSATSSFKNGQPTPPPTNDTPKQFKKGSYAEIMARAKANQQEKGSQVGKIVHKKIEKLPSKREREEMKAQKSRNIQGALAPNSKFRTPGQAQIRDGKNGMKDKNGKIPAEPEKRVKKAALATTGYAGTARPRPGAATPASKSSAASSSSRYDGGPDRYQGKGSSSRRYTYVSEEEEDDEDEQEDYYSDELSDMEAAAFEVDEEEEHAARIARREDAEALAEENRLKREKEEKKRRLAAMAKKARK